MQRNHAEQAERMRERADMARDRAKGDGTWYYPAGVTSKAPCEGSPTIDTSAPIEAPSCASQTNERT